MISLPHIFGPPTHLHLVLWNRLDLRDHAKAMQAICSLLESDIAKEIMPLIRPIGRARQTYRTYAMDGTFEKADTVNLDRAPLLDDKHTAHCELWVQVADSANSDAKTELKQLFGSLNSVCFLWEHNNPLWQPLGSGKFDFPYSQSRGGTHDKFLCTLCDDRIAWIMKLIWYRASVEICALMIRNSSYTPIHPINDKAGIKHFMARICSDIDLADYGIVRDTKKIDPTDSGASHLAAFAVNSITSVSNGSIYALESYYGNDQRVTRPYMLADREKFLSLFS